MSIPASLRARDPRTAARTAVIVLLVCTGMMALVGVIGPSTDSDASSAVVWACCAGLSATAGIFHWVPAQRLDRVGGFIGLAVIGVTVLCALAVEAGGTSTRGQAFLVFVVLYAGFHLRTAGAVLVTAQTIVAGGIMLFTTHAVESAFTDFVFFGCMLGVTGGLLTRSVNAQERLVGALTRQADVDALTGLVTRRVLDRALTTALARTGPEAGTALLLMDVDEFKSINDAHGHLAGDDALVHLSKIIKQQTRSSDAVVSRMGGDEVAVLLRDCTRDTAVRRAEQLLDAVRGEPLVLPDGTLYGLSISLGVAHADRSGDDLRTLYAAADDALYAAKRGGRGRVEVAFA
ncbi:GGDEF domain-containing protein [Blastococcus sp. TF02-8]|uniref:GGDEF domain-containing protein n=1 Tax=Blastococcus sp. TF02-8 TaxID=2250574 RepID=UPI000DE8441E|nr:GGDEF domain-containing protein [Blastococcus sp. TF02-8]RBY96288.1 GGDEF domain-containing protein [Blastococcus sp. TF02-8]